MLTKVGRTTNVGRIVEEIRLLILRGSLSAGQRLPSERALAEEFGVGPGSVREDLSSLVALIGALIARGVSRMLEEQVECHREHRALFSAVESGDEDGAFASISSSIDGRG